MDFLLSKASEYSNFIAKDLEELQESMTEHARKTMAKAEKKKRSGNGVGKNGKKRKTGDDEQQEGATSLESVQAQDDATRRGELARPIFIQPPNLASDCFLKGYQLEGVRWLASLFENGVSGILADGTYNCLFVSHRLFHRYICAFSML